MLTVGEGVARAFVEFEPLQAYRLDILGNIAGIVAFSLLSFAGAPPVGWALIVGILLLLLLAPTLRRVQLISVAVLVLMLGLESALPLESWSPYYRISLSPELSGAVLISVNGIPHQTIESVAQRQASVPLYFLPYSRLRTSPKDVLIVGAGTGNDVAIALAQGAQHIDAVEIDPLLHEIGVNLHPGHPYQNPRVTSYIDDGRAFLQQSDHRYDLILFTATALAFVPIFIANLVFAQRFKAVGSSNVAFGANLLGAMVGGVLEYSSLLLGYRALLPVIAGLYVIALVLWLRVRPRVAVQV
jgi:hypothetical protein